MDLLVVPEINADNSNNLPADAVERAVHGEYGQVRTFTLVGVGVNVGQVTQPDNASIVFPHAFDKETHPGADLRRVQRPARGRCTRRSRIRCRGRHAGARRAGLLSDDVERPAPRPSGHCGRR